MGWRISHYINLNSVCNDVSLQSVIEHGSGKFSTALPAVISSESCSTVAAGRAPFRNHGKMTAMVFSRAPLRVRQSWSTQILLCHVLDLRTPLLRQREVTDSFSSEPLFCASSERFWKYVLPTTARVIYSLFFRFGGSAFCVSPVFVRTRRENLLLLWWQSLLHVYSPSRYFSTFVSGRPRELIVSI